MLGRTKMQKMIAEMALFAYPLFSPFNSAKYVLADMNLSIAGMLFYIKGLQ